MTLSFHLLPLVGPMNFNAGAVHEEEKKVEMRPLVIVVGTGFAHPLGSPILLEKSQIHA